MSNVFQWWVNQHLSSLTAVNQISLSMSSGLPQPPVPHTPPKYATGGLVPSPPPPSTPAKRIGTTGMHGYSERGAPEDWDMAAGEVRGYRWWNLSVPPWVVGVGTEEYDEAKRRYFGSLREPGVLTGANSQPWKPGRNEAVCTRMAFADSQHLMHQPPEVREDCGCGFWAYFSPDLRVGEVLGMSPANRPPVTHDGSSYVIPVFGVIRGTGRVIIGEKGFRSQYAEITGLCVPDEARAYMQRWYAPSSGYARDEYNFGSSDTYSRWDEYASYRNLGPASPEEEPHRAAAAETLLSEAFPKVKVMSGRETLTKYFPPDKNYYSG